MPAPYQDVSVRDYSILRTGDHAPRLIDVREPHEYHYCHIEGAELKPLSQIKTWWRELDPAEDYVLVCHHGFRSAHACFLLAQAGFSQLSNLVGGVDAWAADIDPTMPRY